ncbi:MAG: hypothetical protein IKW65_06780 [Bacteroidales bacterium]|nr:hypothetical protein [Bacteroidales bacterium]
MKNKFSDYNAPEMEVIYLKLESGFCQSNGDNENVDDPIDGGELTGW